jgi:two-component system alkaline phosphatase synthesis response regulator PhoP
MVEPARRVLIIDDDDGIREVAKMSLELVGGWTVSTAPSGGEGIRQAREQRPDGILLDVMMPDLDGPATLEQLRSDEVVGATPVIFLTAKVQASDRSRFAELDVAGLITKPFDPMTLPERVAELFGWSS